jgi:ribosomal protein L37E
MSDFSYADLDDKSGTTERDCPKCGKKTYNDVNIDKPEHDFCEICGWNCVD